MKIKMKYFIILFIAQNLNKLGICQEKRSFIKHKKWPNIWWFGQIAKKSPNIWPKFGQNNNIFWWNLVKFLAKKISIFFGQNFWRFWASLESVEYFDVLVSIETQKNCHLSNNTKFCVIQIQNNTKNNVLFDITHFLCPIF